MRKTKKLASFALLTFSISAHACIDFHAPCLLSQFSIGDIIDPGGAILREGAKRTGIPTPPTLGSAIDSGGKIVNQEVQKLGDYTFRTLTNAAGDVVREASKAGGDVVRTVEKAGKDTTATVQKAGSDFEANYVKAWKDAGRETANGLQEASDAIGAAARYSAREMQGTIQTAEAAAKQVSDGKVLDAMWTASIKRTQQTEEHFFKATQESAIIGAAAQSAAAVYGGPGGAAAYAAWATYKATGDANLAFRVGAMAAVTAQYGPSVKALPSGTVAQVVKKAALSGAAGGIAIAAAGGDEKAISDGFMKGAGMVLVQGGQEALGAYKPTLKQHLTSVQCISARDTRCLSENAYVRGKLNRIENRLATKKTELGVGKWTAIDKNSPAGRAAAMIVDVAKLPKSQVIPVLGNKWVLTSSLGQAADIKAKTPAVVLTYVGKNPPFMFTSTYRKKTKAQTTAPKNLVRAPGTPTARATFLCTGPNSTPRTVEIRSSAASCEATDIRKDGRTNLWRSPRDGQICVRKAQTFMTKLTASGISCRKA